MKIHHSNFVPGETVITDFELFQNHPNPFNPRTSIGFALPTHDRVNLSVFDINGRLVNTVIDKPIAAGNYQVVFEAYNLPSGIYFLRLAGGNAVKIRKMSLIK